MASPGGREKNHRFFKTLDNSSLFELVEKLDLAKEFFGFDAGADYMKFFYALQESIAEVRDVRAGFSQTTDAGIMSDAEIAVMLSAVEIKRYERYIATIKYLESNPSKILKQWKEWLNIKKDVRARLVAESREFINRATGPSDKYRRKRTAMTIVKLAANLIDSAFKAEVAREHVERDARNEWLRAVNTMIQHLDKGRRIELQAELDAVVDSIDIAMSVALAGVTLFGAAPAAKLAFKIAPGTALRIANICEPLKRGLSLAAVAAVEYSKKQAVGHLLAPALAPDELSEAPFD